VLSVIALLISLAATKSATSANARRRQPANRARPVIWPNGSSSTVDDRRFGYIIRNQGKVTAHNVHVWLYDENGHDVSIKPQTGFALAPDESVDKYGVTVPPDVQPLDVRFGIRWEDGAGHHKVVTHIPPTL
jgi:hypothetical protein